MRSAHSLVCGQLEHYSKDVSILIFVWYQLMYFEKKSFEEKQNPDVNFS